MAEGMGRGKEWKASLHLNKRLSAPARGSTWIGYSSQVPADPACGQWEMPFYGEGHSSRAEVSRDLRAISCDAQHLASGVSLSSTPTMRQDETQVDTN